MFRALGTILFGGNDDDVREIGAAAVLLLGPLREMQTRRVRRKEGMEGKREPGVYLPHQLRILHN